MGTLLTKIYCGQCQHADLKYVLILSSAVMQTVRASLPKAAFNAAADISAHKVILRTLSKNAQGQMGGQTAMSEQVTLQAAIGH